MASANENFLLYPVVAILFLVCISPLFLAYSSLRALVQLFFKQEKNVRIVSPLILALMIFISISAVAAELVISRVIETGKAAALAELINNFAHLILVKLSFEPIISAPTFEVKPSSPQIESSLSKLTLGPILLALIIINLIGRIQICELFRYKNPLGKLENVIFNIALTIMVISAAVTITASENDRLDPLAFIRPILDYPLIANNINYLVTKLALYIMVLIILWAARAWVLYSIANKADTDIKNPRIDYLNSALTATCMIAIICQNASIIAWACILIFADIAYLTIRYRPWAKLKAEENEGYSFQAKHYAPPFETILILKALFLTTGAVQLTYPIIMLDFPLRNEIIAYTLKGNLSGSLAYLPNSYFAVDQLTEIIWLALAFLGLVVIFLSEYGWIVRPFMPERENPAMGQARKQPEALFSHHDESRWPNSTSEFIDKSREDNKQNARRIENFRAISRVTLPWLIISAWIPAIVVRINLGFEMLKHQSVIFAMLHGMRTQYLRNLFSPLATSTLLVNAVKFILLLLAINMVAHYSFGLYNLSGHYSSETTIPSFQIAVNDLNRPNTNYELRNL